jgi:uncharacterized membrane protein (UPF0127 family)
MSYADSCRLPFICLLLSCAVLAACQKTLPLIDLELGSAKFRVEVAANAGDRQLGLMHRDSLGERAGMLFVFPRDQNVAFWMKDTKIPLSVAYISSDGTIREIHDLSPGSLAAIESAVAVRFALEVPRGAFGRAGLKAGDKLNLPKPNAVD